MLRGNQGSDILYMFKMKAEKPEKYRENVQVSGVEPVREMLDRLTEMAAQRLERERRELEQSSVEGEYREMGEEGHN
jgi:spore cortex formation protein SpoVR/YcgB (stage V sporulation)